MSITKRLPPKVDLDPRRGELRGYWLDRVRQHTQDSYAGVPLSKFPEDLRVYEHLLWLDPPDTVIELGTQFGGSALWFRDRLATLGGYGRIARTPRVITVDVDQRPAREVLSGERGIYPVEGRLEDPATVERVAGLVGRRCLVVEDSAHDFETTTAALDSYARFVPAGGFMVVEDGCVDIEELRLDGWPRGVLAALEAWLGTQAGSGFVVRRDLELYGVTCHPSGFLQRRPE